MRIDLLIPGLTFNNYKQLCSELGIEAKASTKSKKYQLRELERYCVFHKDGHKFVIDEVYDEPLEKEDRRGKSDIYKTLVEFLIADLLAQYKGHIAISRNRLLYDIGIININYSTCGENVRRFSVYKNLDENTVYDFFNISKSNFKRIIETALKSLRDKRDINYTIVNKVSVRDEYLNRKATVEEDRQILEYEKEILLELGYLSMKDVRKSGDWHWFKKRVKELLNKNTDIKFYYSAYEIQVNDKYIDETRNNLLELLLDDIERIRKKNELNATVADNFMKNAQTRHENELLNSAWGTPKNIRSKARRSESYITEFDELVNWLIKRDSRDIRDDVLNTEVEKTLSEELEDIEGSLEDMFG